MRVTRHAVFFEVKRSRAWIITRRIAHTAHHRGQQMAHLRVFDRDVHSTYGPTADTGSRTTRDLSLRSGWAAVFTCLFQRGLAVGC
jgi:uncharacterized damage-inducible protein DinB